MKYLILGFLFIFIGIRSGYTQNYCLPNGIQTEINIAAPTDTVWKYLVDFENYPHWHPFLRHIDGESKKGKMQKFKAINKNGSETNFRAKIIEFQSSTKLSWGGSVGFIFNAKHYFYLESIDNQTTKLIQGEYWHGVFGKTYGKKIYKETYEKFLAMNEKLKILCEK